MAKYVHSSVDIGNHRYTNVQNCILLKYKCDLKKLRGFFCLFVCVLRPFNSAFI